MTDIELIGKINAHVAGLNAAIRARSVAPEKLTTALARELIDAGCTVEVDGLSIRAQLPLVARMFTIDLTFTVDP